MSFRPLIALTALLATACEVNMDSGPERERAAVFSVALGMQAGQTLVLRNMSGEMTIEPSSDDTLRVVADMRWRGDSTLPSDVKFLANATADGALVCSIFGEGQCTADQYEGKSDGSGIRIGGGNVSLGLGGGSQAQVHFRVQVPAGVKLDLVMVDGDITSASSAPVKARGVNSDLRIVTSVGPVRAESVNGDVDARMTSLAGSDSVKVGTINGNAFAFLPENAAATVDVGTTNGSLVTDFPAITGRENLRKSVTAVLGAGTTPVRVRSMNGDAQLRRLDAQGRAYDIDQP